MAEGQIAISVCQGQYAWVNGQLVRVGIQVIIDRPGRGRRVYMNPSTDSFFALTELIERHRLRAHPCWGTMVGYTVHWTPGKRANKEGERGDES